MQPFSPARLGRRPFLLKSSTALAACLTGSRAGVRRTAAAPRQGTATTLAVAISHDATNLDASRALDVYSSRVQAQVCEPLFVAAPDLSIAMNVIGSLEQPDPVTYILHPFDGISFQDGTPLDGEAVRWNLQRHIDDPHSARHGDVAGIIGIEVGDTLTVSIKLAAPFAPQLSKLTAGAGYIYSPTTYESNPDGISSSLAGAGSGPFIWEIWEPDSFIVLSRNPQY